MDLAIDSRSTSRRLLMGGGIACWGLQPVVDCRAQRDLLVRRRQGCIVVKDRQLVAIHGRWWAYSGNVLRVLVDQHRRAHRQQDACELYFHQSFSVPDFLTLAYVRSDAGTSLSTFYAATLVLDEIARLKNSSAIVTNVVNARISERLLRRWNWRRHCLSWRGRHYIKRFYGQFPDIPDIWRERLRMELEPAQQITCNRD